MPGTASLKDDAAVIFCFHICGVMYHCCLKCRVTTGRLLPPTAVSGTWLPVTSFPSMTTTEPRMDSCQSHTNSYTAL
jgi:hypothetical protein